MENEKDQLISNYFWHTKIWWKTFLPELFISEQIFWEKKSFCQQLSCKKKFGEKKSGKKIC